MLARYRVALFATVTAGVLAMACQSADEDGQGGTGGSLPTGGSGGTGGQAPKTVSVLTWNLENFPLSSQTTSRVAQILSGLDVDLIAIQEIDRTTAFEDLVSRMNGYEGLLNDDPAGQLRVGFVYKTSRFSVASVDTLFSDDWYPFPRPPLKAHLSATVQGGGVFDFVFIVVHLKAQLDLESEDRRRQACIALERWIGDQLYLSPEEQDFVVVGDWNDNLTDGPSSNVFGPFLEAPETYTFLTMELEQQGEYTYLPFESFIDHVLVTNDALDEYGNGTTEALHLETTTADYDTHISDHRPVQSTFAVVP